MLKAEFRSNLNKFIALQKDKKRIVLEEIMKEGLAEIGNVTPVKSGYLKSQNKASISNEDTITFYNNAEYAEFVEFGTYRMRAQYFMRRGISALKNKVPQILKERLGV